MQIPQVNQNLHLKDSNLQLQNQKALLTNDKVIGLQRVRTLTLQEQPPEKRRKTTNWKRWIWETKKSW